MTVNHPPEYWAEALFEAKTQEKLAKKTVLALEEKLAAALDCPDDGSKTHDLEKFKVVVKRGFTYKADIEAMSTAGATTWPVETKKVFNKTLWKRIKDDFPEDAKLLSEFIVTKPAKTSITISKVEG